MMVNEKNLVTSTRYELQMLNANGEPLTIFRHPDRDTVLDFHVHQFGRVALLNGWRLRVVEITVKELWVG